MEAAKKLAAEPDIPKLARKKRRRNCLDAMQRLQEIEDEMNQYRLKKGQKPTQRASLLIAGAEDKCIFIFGRYFYLKQFTVHLSHM